MVDDFVCQRNTPLLIADNVKYTGVRLMVLMLKTSSVVWVIVERLCAQVAYGTITRQQVKILSLGDYIPSKCIWNITEYDVKQKSPIYPSRCKFPISEYKKVLLESQVINLIGKACLTNRQRLLLVLPDVYMVWYFFTVVSIL